MLVTSTTSSSAFNLTHFLNEEISSKRFFCSTGHWSCDLRCKHVENTSEENLRLHCKWYKSDAWGQPLSLMIFFLVWPRWIPSRLAKIRFKRANDSTEVWEPGEPAEDGAVHFNFEDKGKKTLSGQLYPDSGQKKVALRRQIKRSFRCQTREKKNWKCMMQQISPHLKSKSLHSFYFKNLYLQIYR